MLGGLRECKKIGLGSFVCGEKGDTVPKSVFG